MNPDDAELVSAALGGDRAAMDRLLRQHYDRVYAVCRRVTGNDADAADAAQEALLLIVRNLGKFDGRSSLSTWIYRVATNASLDELRRRRRRPTTSIGDRHDGGGDGDRDAAMVDHRAQPRVEAIADRLQLDAALAALPEDFRVPIVLRDVGDLDYSEIADTLSIPVGTVKSRIARGRAQLAELLRAGNREPLPHRPSDES